MTRFHRHALGLAAVLALGWGLLAAEPADLSEYRTVDTAVTAKATKAAGTILQRPAYLGVSLAADDKGRLSVAEVADESPAARAGVKKGDLLSRLDGKEPKDEDAFLDLLRGKSPGDGVKLSLTREGKPVEVTATLGLVSRPMASGKQRALLGVQVKAAKEEGVVIEQVTAATPAEKSKLKVGEVILKVDGVAVNTSEKLRDVLAEKKPDDTVTLTLLLAEKPVEMKVKLGAEAVVEGSGRPGGWDTRVGGYWNKPVYKLGIILVEYPDQKHNEKITPKAWEESMFSQGTYKTSVTGQTAYGSMYDYYWEQSYHGLKVEGKAFDYVEVSKKRGDYASGDRTALLTEALDKIIARDGKDALKDLDGVFYVYAGDRYPSPRGSLYWPHRSSVRHNGKSWPYFICPEGGGRMTNISVFCHEFGHMLGLPDLYARPENPGMEGLGVWCAMANQVGNGRPQHFCAWSKERLGWVKPTVIDPTVKQKLVLSPIEEDPKQCFKVLLRPDGSEYLLLENKKKKGFDQSLPAEGLLIWRVVGNRPTLQESHGVEGPQGPGAFLTSVPYPSGANDSYTPFTTPSSRSQLGGGLPVYITNIRKLPDGRVTFHIGYEYQ